MLILYFSQLKDKLKSIVYTSGIFLTFHIFILSSRFSFSFGPPVPASFFYPFHFFHSGVSFKYIIILVSSKKLYRLLIYYKI